MVIGAGAVGGSIGGRLAYAGLPVLLVARGPHLAALQADGLRLRTPTEDIRVPVRAVGGPDEAELTEDDVLVVATKTQQVPGLIAEWADAPVVGGATAGQRLPVLMALNGVASEPMALRYFDRVFGVCVWLPAVHLVPGEVIIRGAPTSGMLHIGRVPAAVDPADPPLLAGIRDDLTAASFDVVLPVDVMPWKYRKLISNLGNVFQALVGFTSEVKPLLAEAEREAREVLDAARIGYTGDAEEAAARAAGFTMHPVPGVPERVGGSTWQSLARGTGDLETDYLNGEIALVARRIGRSAPVNATLARLARETVRAGRPPGSMSVADVRAALLQAGALGR